MYRYALENLKQWKQRSNRKPLILQGARQVGKTWLMQEFGRLEFKQTVYINFEFNEEARGLFERNLDPIRITQSLSAMERKEITPDTLLIFDEIQACPRALTSLKYFCENLPQQPVLAAGSLLGVFLHQHTSFPVGKVEFLHVYPLSFMEFLQAMGEDLLYQLLLQRNFANISDLKPTCEDLLKQYYYVGGMPAVVAEFAKTKNYQTVRQMQLELLNAYEGDFSKYPPANMAQRIREVWRSIPNQLAKENKKFIYGVIREGARAKEYELAIEWLQNCGLIYKLQRISKPGMPLSMYQDLSAFKLFMVDVGLLGAASKLDDKTLIDGSSMLSEFKGALTEQYVLQQLKTDPYLPVYYWTSNAQAEVDFVIQYDNKIIPIEAKATTNLRAKSLKYYCEQYKPEIALRFSMADYKQTDNLYDIPLCMVELFRKII
ncbi:MAG: ATP-binding protein [Elusimicrobiaceae bacterium]|nr:ATP-binding protein [Elusimicrobiaceae bacterium]